MSRINYGHVFGQDDWEKEAHYWSIAIPEQVSVHPWVVAAIKHLGPSVELLPLIQLRGTGHAGSDVLWNNFHGYCEIGYFEPLNETTKSKEASIRASISLMQARILPFTSNCGAKQISHLMMAPPLQAVPEFAKTCLKALEWVLFDRCCAGMLVGSDTMHGGTMRIIDTYGTGWRKSDVVHNPTYTHIGVERHEIAMFYKTQTKPERPNVLADV